MNHKLRHIWKHRFSVLRQIEGNATVTPTPRRELSMQRNSRNSAFPFGFIDPRVVLALLLAGVGTTFAMLTLTPPTPSRGVGNALADSSPGAAGQCELVRSPAGDAPNNATGGD